MQHQPFAWAAVPLFKDSGELAVSGTEDLVLKPLLRYDADHVGTHTLLEQLQLAANPKASRRIKTLSGELVLRISARAAADVVQNCLSPSLLPVQVRWLALPQLLPWPGDGGSTATLAARRGVGSCVATAVRGGRPGLQAGARGGGATGRGAGAAAVRGVLPLPLRVSDHAGPQPVQRQAQRSHARYGRIHAAAAGRPNHPLTVVDPM